MATNRKCFSCKKSHNTPNSYMLTCKTCKRHWHHTCHQPLITEAELIGLVSASTRKSQFGSLETWVCRKCKNRASASVAEPSTSPAPLPAPSVPIVLDTTPAEQVGRIASKQVRGWPDASSSRSASKLPTQGRSATRLSSEAAVIELLDDSDDDIVEVSPTPGPQLIPPREALRTAARNSETIHTPPEGRGDINIRPSVSQMPSAAHSVSNPSDNPSTKEGRTGQRNSVSMQVEKISSAVNLARTMPARSRRSPSAGPSQPRLPVPTPMQIPMIPATAGSSSTPDFRQLIATMRSQGQLQPPPSYVYTSQPRNVADMELDASPVDVSAPDSDIEMADAHEYDHDRAMEPSPAPAQRGPDDLEDMYADPVKKEEPVDAPFLHNRTTRSRGSDETKNNLPGWICDYEETEEDDSWTTAFQERAERVSMRKATGVRPPRKRQALGNRNKRESFEVIRRSAIPAEVNLPQSPQQRWTAGMLELERLFE